MGAVGSTDFVERMIAGRRARGAASCSKDPVLLGLAPLDRHGLDGRPRDAVGSDRRPHQPSATGRSLPPPPPRSASAWWCRDHLGRGIVRASARPATPPARWPGESRATGEIARRARWPSSAPPSAMPRRFSSSARGARCGGGGAQPREGRPSPPSRTSCGRRSTPSTAGSRCSAPGRSTPPARRGPGGHRAQRAGPVPSRRRPARHVAASSTADAPGKGAARLVGGGRARPSTSSCRRRASARTAIEVMPDARRGSTGIGADSPDRWNLLANAMKIHARGRPD